jgi:hypothetical protein
MAAEAMSWIWQLTLLSVIEQRPCLLLALRTSSSLGAVSLSVTSGAASGPALLAVSV